MPVNALQALQSRIKHCTHCDELIVAPIYLDQEQAQADSEIVFCCQGCLTVYQILHQKGLDDYYSIKDRAGTIKPRSPVEMSKSKFQYIDSHEFQKEFSYRNLNNEPTMEFYLEGIHCLACLWLIEKLPSFLASVSSAKLNIEQSIVVVSLINEDALFSEVARELNQLGYRPHPLKQDQNSHDLKIKEDRRNLLRIGIAAAGSSNIMIYAVSIYGGASDAYASIFNFLTVAFALPVLTYSATPFYQSAYHAIKNKQLSIDIPISIALLVGFGLGLYNLFTGVNENFFDSLTMLVFLLLLSRYFLKKIQERALSANDLNFFYQSESIQKISYRNDQEVVEEIHPKYLKKDDLIQIMPGELIPVDGIITEGQSSLNTSLLTGESENIRVRNGDYVFAGTQNMSYPLKIKTELIGSSTRLGQILKSVEQGWVNKAPVIELTDRISKYFILGVFSLSVLLFAYHLGHSGFKFAIEQALTLLIVTCPCALALATPLAFTRSLSKASDHGIIIKNDAVLQKLSEAQNLYIDKTGTITYGKPTLAKIKTLKEGLLPLADIIFSLEAKSRHPIALALVRYAKNHHGKVLPVDDYEEILGKGVEGHIRDHFYEISNGQILEDGKLIAQFSIDDHIREDVIPALQNIKKNNVSVKILSGDTQVHVNQVADLIGVNYQDAHGSLAPEEKGRIVANSAHSIMIGDGANDAIALTKASVGIAVHSAMDISLRAADVFLAVPGLTPISRLITLSKETMRLIKRNLALSLIYNFISVIAAFMGLITPLTAAIIMPVSSLIVLLSTVLGTKRMRSLWKS